METYPTKCIRVSVLFLILYAQLTSCAYDSMDDEVDTEERQSLLLMLATPRDFRSACVSDQDEALACLNAAGVATATYTGLLQTVYKITIVGTTSTDICSVLPGSPYFPNPLNDPASPNYKTYSDASKTCTFSCENKYWTAMRSASNCTGANYPTALSVTTHALYMPNHVVYKDCIEGCFVTGSVLPPL